MNQHGYFISFEGGDGAGKTTQLRLLAQWLEQQGFEVLQTRQPGATRLGAELRHLLLSGEFLPVAECELLLFLADRAQHVREVIQPALQAGQWVLCDRYSDSTLAYQLAARKLADDCDLLPMLRFAEVGVSPDLTLWLDVSSEVAAKRMQAREAEGEPATRLDTESLLFHQRVQQAFVQIHQQHAGRVQRIDASLSIHAMQQKVQAVVKQKLPLN